MDKLKTWFYLVQIAPPVLFLIFRYFSSPFSSTWSTIFQLTVIALILLALFNLISVIRFLMHRYPFKYVLIPLVYLVMFSVSAMIFGRLEFGQEGMDLWIWTYSIIFPVLYILFIIVFWIVDSKKSLRKV